MADNDFETLIRALAIDAAAKNRDFRDMQIRVRQNGSGTFQFGTEPANTFQGPNTFAEQMRIYVRDNAE